MSTLITLHRWRQRSRYDRYCALGMCASITLHRWLRRTRYVLFFSSRYLLFSVLGMLV